MLLQKRFSPHGDPRNVLDKGTEGPYRRALNNMDFYVRAATKRNYFFLTVIIALSVCLCYVALTAGFKTYVVRIDGATGNVDLSGRLSQDGYVPEETEVRHMLLTLVTRLRNLPMEREVYDSNMASASAYLTSQAAQEYVAFSNALDEGDARKFGGHNTCVSVTEFVAQGGGNFRVRWREDDFSRLGAKTDTRNYVGLFTVGVEPPRSEQEMLLNPLGLKVLTMSFTSETADLPASGGKAADNARRETARQENVQDAVSGSR